MPSHPAGLVMSPRPHASSSSSPSAAPTAPESDRFERLQKVLAAAGLGSRRRCEELILAGRVEVERRVVATLGAKADPQQQEIRVDGVSLPRPRLVYFLVNKPVGVVSTNNDPSGRPRVVDLIPYPGRLFTVGRLDMSSEGLILVTNDGELANRLTHPRYGVEKTYQVEVAGMLDRKELEKLRQGVHLAEGFARVVSAKVIRQYKQSSLLEIVLNEGRNREIRRLLARVGHKVQRLKRVAIGPLRLADLPVGHVRPLARDEVRRLKQASHGVSHQPPCRPAVAALAKPAKAAATARRVIGANPVKVARALRAAGSTKKPRRVGPHVRPPRPVRAKPSAGKKPRS
jgi:23S rRNA pseudouridine2605 synthase